MRIQTENYSLETHFSNQRRWTKGKANNTIYCGASFSQSDLTFTSLSETEFDVETDETALKEIFNGLTGFYAKFATVKDSNLIAYALVDKCRSIPLFYSVVEDDAKQRIYVSDDANWIADQIVFSPPSKKCRIEFLLSGFVSGSETLHPGIKQIPAGHFLMFKKVPDHGIQALAVRYSNFITRHETELSLDEQYVQMSESLKLSIDRMLKFANGDQIVIPLSGGYDSRLIALEIAKREYKNVVTFTYGRPGNLESIISKKVAESLNMAWHFVPYSNQLWKDWAGSEKMNDFLKYAHQLTSCPHIQDIIAIQSLKDTGVIDDNAILVPGHSGDFVAGSHIFPSFFQKEAFSFQEFFRILSKKHLNLWPLSNFSKSEIESVKGKYLDSFEGRQEFKQNEAIGYHDNWDHSERQAKFVVNSVRSYEFFGLRWWLPLYDWSFITFWKNASLEARKNQFLYNKYIISEYSKFTGVSNSDASYSEKSKILIRIWAQLRRHPKLIKIARKFYFPIKRRRAYNNHPLAWYGFIDQKTFKKSFTGQETINSFIAQRVLDESTLVD